jgi:uncharacterized Fe-S radical SAM superfamily protein PflX
MSDTTRDTNDQTTHDTTRVTRAPSYLALHESGELARRVEALERLLHACTVCPLVCGNDRTRNELARCYSGALPIVSSYTAHFGEEPALTGAKGAGNIFFGNCDSRNSSFSYNNLRGNGLTVDGF